MTNFQHASMFVHLEISEAGFYRENARKDHPGDSFMEVMFVQIWVYKKQNIL